MIVGPHGREEFPMPDTKTTRRGFLQGSGCLLMGTLAVTSGSIAMLAPSRSWAVELSTLNEHQSKTLLRFTRHLYPHDTLEDAVYALVVKDLDAAATDDPDVRQLLSNGIRRLDGAAGGDWLGLSA